MATVAGDPVAAGLFCTLADDEFAGEFLMDNGDEKDDSVPRFGP